MSCICCRRTRPAGTAGAQGFQGPQADDGPQGPTGSGGVGQIEQLAMLDEPYASIADALPLGVSTILLAQPREYLPQWDPNLVLQFPENPPTTPTFLEWAVDLGSLLGANLTPSISGIATIGSTVGTAQIELYVGATNPGSLVGATLRAVAVVNTPATDVTWENTGAAFARPAPGPTPTLVQLAVQRTAGGSGPENALVYGVVVSFRGI